MTTAAKGFDTRRALRRLRLAMDALHDGTGGNVRRDVRSRDVGHRDPAVAKVAAALVVLEASLPLEVDEASDVREALTATLRQGEDWRYLSVDNSLGKKERHTTWSVRDVASVVAWEECRRHGYPGDDPWSEAARGPRRIGSTFGADFIDRGVYLAMDLLRDLGTPTRISCEGHPRGAYLILRGRDRAVTKAFTDAGWLAETTDFPPETDLRMPTVSSVEGRDASWKDVTGRLQAALDDRLAERPSPGP